MIRNLINKNILYKIIQPWSYLTYKQIIINYYHTYLKFGQRREKESGREINGKEERKKCKKETEGMNDSFNIVA